MKDNYFGFDQIQRRTLERLLEMIPTVPEGASIIMPGFIPLYDTAGTIAIAGLGLTLDGNVVERIRLQAPTQGIVNNNQSYSFPVSGYVTASVTNNQVEMVLPSNFGTVNDGLIIATTGGYVTFTVTDNVVTCEFTAV